MFIPPVPLIIRGRIIRRFKKMSAVDKNSAKTLVELGMDKFPFTGFGSKHIFKRLQNRGWINNDGDKFYLAK